MPSVIAAGRGSPPLLRAAVIFVHAAARMERQPEPVGTSQHQTMEAGGVDPGFRIARRDLPRGDIGRGVDPEMERDRQLGQVDRVSFEHHLLPGSVRSGLHRQIVLAALAVGSRQVLGRNVEGESEQLPVTGDVGDHRHVEPLDILEDHDRAAARPFELEHCRRDVEIAADRLGHAQHVIRRHLLHLVDEASQALLFHDAVDLRALAGIEHAAAAPP